MVVSIFFGVTRANASLVAIGKVLSVVNLEPLVLFNESMLSIFIGKPIVGIDHTEIICLLYTLFQTNFGGSDILIGLTLFGIKNYQIFRKNSQRKTSLQNFI